MHNTPTRACRYYHAVLVRSRGRLPGTGAESSRGHKSSRRSAAGQILNPGSKAHGVHSATLGSADAAPSHRSMGAPSHNLDSHSHSEASRTSRRRGPGTVRCAIPVADSAQDAIGAAMSAAKSAATVPEYEYYDEDSTALQGQDDKNRCDSEGGNAEGKNGGGTCRAQLFALCLP